MAIHRVARIARNVALGAMLTLPAVASPPAHAQSLPAGTDALARAALPLSPLFFDIAVGIGRSFAEITYDSRGYDALTNSFHVSGLRVKRYSVDVGIGRLRTDLRSIMIEGVAVETQGIGLPPPLRAALRRLGGSTVKGDILLGVSGDAASSSYDVSLRLDLPSMGTVEFSAGLDGFHVLVPIPSSETSSYSPEPTLAGSLRSASLAFENYGLMAVALDMAAQQAGAPPEQFKAGLALMPQQVAAQFLQALPGGASPEFTRRVRGWAAVAEEFLREEDAVRVTLAPAEPVQLWRLMSGFVDEKLVVDLNPEAMPAFAAPLPAPAEPGSVAAAAAQIAGTGVPQDRAEGARALLKLVEAGDRAALSALARNFGSHPHPALNPPELSALYAQLLVARAFGERVDDAVLAALTAVIVPDELLTAENRSWRLFASLGGKDVFDPANMADVDADDLRRAAYDYYEGRVVPRNYGRSLALALAASAAGNGFARQLRDDITAAVDRKAIVVDMMQARGAAEAIWAAFSGAPKP